MPKNYRKDLGDYIKRPINLMRDAKSLRLFRLSSQFTGRGGGNWSIPILCFIAMEALGTINWLLHHKSLCLKDVRHDFRRFLSPEEKLKISTDKVKNEIVGASARFAALILAAKRTGDYTFPRRVSILREIWETFRNIPIHYAGFKFGTAGTVFLNDPYTPRQLERILNSYKRMIQEPDLGLVSDNGRKVKISWHSFYRLRDGWHCFGDILCVEVVRLAKWLQKSSRSHRITDVKRAVVFIDRKVS